VIFKEKSRLAPSKFRLALTNGTSSIRESDLSQISCQAIVALRVKTLPFSFWTGNPRPCLLRPALGNGRFRLNSDIPIKGKMGKNTRVRKRFIGKSILTIPEET
jgi:hypothetical protein